MANQKIPKLTRCCFQFIADTIKTIDFDCTADRQRVIEEFTDALRATNSNFKPERFRTACQNPRLSGGAR